MANIKMKTLTLGKDVFEIVDEQAREDIKELQENGVKTSVESVNGKAGVVTLDASDVGALSASDIVDGLTSTESNKALSARSGFQLNSKLTTLRNELNNLEGDGTIEVDMEKGTFSHKDSGVAANWYGEQGGGDLSFGGSFTVPGALKIDAKGHITEAKNNQFKLPDNEATEAKKGLLSATDKAKLNKLKPPFNFEIGANTASNVDVNVTLFDSDDGEVARFGVIGTGRATVSENSAGALRINVADQDLSAYAKNTDVDTKIATVEKKIPTVAQDIGDSTTATMSQEVISRKLYEIRNTDIEQTERIDSLSEEIVDINKDILDLQLAVGDGGDGSQKWIGETPFTMTDDASLLTLLGEGDYSFEIKSTTVADMDSASEPRCTNCELVKVGKYYELRATGGTAWYNSYADFVISGLTIGESYTLYIDALGRTYSVDDSEAVGRTFGHHSLSAGTSYNSSAVIGTPNENVSATQHGTPAYNIDAYKLTFTATTESVTLRSFPASNSTFTKHNGNVVAEFNSFYINRTGSNKHTGIINVSGTFTDMRTLSDVPIGAIVTTDPVCDIYAAIVKEDEENAVYMPLKDKTVVCFGDSLFGMYRGNDSAPAYIAELTGATVHNVGFGGCRMSVHPTSGYAAFSMWALAKAIVENDWTPQDAQASSGSAYFPDQLALLKSIDFSTVDYVVIHYGTNDFGAGTAIPIDNESDHDDYNTLCGALRYSIEKLLGAYPKLKIFVSLPVFRFWTESGVTTYSDAYVKHGMKLTEFVKALRSTASEYNLPVIDGYYGLGINKANASAFLSDGTHHNADGRQRFGEYIGANLIAQQTTAVSGGGGVDTSAVNQLIEEAIGSAIGGAY